MGYWDRKEAEERKESGETTQEVTPVSGKDIDYAGLELLETETNDTAKEKLQEIDDLAAQVKRQKAHMKDITSATYWFAVVFNNDTQKEEFLERLGINPKYMIVDGRELAKNVGFVINEPDHYLRKKGVTEKYRVRARDITPKNNGKG